MSGCRALALALFGLGSLSAQESVEFQHRRFVAPDERIAATIDSTVGGTRGGGYGWVRVSLHNPDDEKHRIDFELEDRWHRTGPAYLVTRSIVLEPQQSAVEYLPLPALGRRGALRLTADGFDSGRANVWVGTDSRGGALSVLMLSSAVDEEADWTVALQNMTSTIDVGSDSRWENGSRVVTRREAVPEVPRRSPDTLPSDWRLLTSFDLIVVDGRSALPADVQRSLLDYVEVGGHVLLTHADSLDPNAELRSTWRDVGQGVTTARHGFGSWLAADGSVSAHWPGDLRESSVVRRWLDPDNSDVFDRPTPFRSGPVQDLFGVRRDIPGMGDMPRGLFLILLLLFAFFAGPFNYFYWKRRRQLPMLLLTVPLAGFGMTGAILLFGLLAEGLGVKGVAESVTFLDQRDHRAVSWTHRKIYAGITPDELHLEPDTYLVSSNVLQDPGWRDRRTHRLEVDWNRGWAIDGSMVPSRYETDLHTATIGTERRRLRFRQRPDGGFECLDSPELKLAPSFGHNIALILRDFDGGYHVGGADGRLEKTSASRVSQASSEMWTGWSAQQRGQSIDDWCADMPRGSYIACTRPAPNFDELGLETEWLHTVHIVLGQLAEEDMIFD